jgi:hypothetical protein
MNILRKLGNALVVVLAIIFVGPGRLAKWLNRKTYDKFIIGIFHAMAAMASGWFLGTSSTSYLHASHPALDLPSYLGWLNHFVTGGFSDFHAGALGVVAFFATAIYLYPIAWLCAIKPLWTACDKIHDALADSLKKNGESLALGVIKVGRFLPFSDRGWQVLLRKDRKSWFVSLMYVIGYPTAVLSSLYLGYHLVNLAYGFFGLGSLLAIGATAVCAVLSLFAVTAIGTILVNAMRYGKVATLGIYTGLAAVVAAGPYLAGFVSSSGLGFAFIALAWLVSFSLFIGYVFPLVNLVLSNEFLKWVAEKIEPICEKTYDGKETPFLHLFHQGLNVIVTGALCFGTYILGSALSLPLWATLPAVALVLFFAYNCVGKALDWSGGNYLLSAVLSIGAGIGVYQLYSAAHLLFGNYGGIFFGVVTSLASAFVIFPLLFLGLAWVATRSITSGLTNACSSGLVRLHKGSYDKVFKPTMKWCADVYETVTKWTYNAVKKVYEKGYNDSKTANYQVMVLQIANVIAAFAVGYGLHFALRGFMTSHATFGVPLAWVTIVVGGGLSFLLVGKLLLRIGLEAVGAVVSMITGFVVGAYVAPLTAYGVALGAGVGLVAAAITYVFAFPLVFIGVRFIANPIFTPWLKPLLNGIYEFGWKRFGKVWDAFMRSFTRFMNFLKPYFNWFIVLVAAGWKKVAAAWDRARAVFDGIFGRKKA